MPVPGFVLGSGSSPPDLNRGTAMLVPGLDAGAALSLGNVLSAFSSGDKTADPYVAFSVRFPLSLRRCTARAEQRIQILRTYQA